jgi:FkbM family methyltransferase
VAPPVDKLRPAKIRAALRRRLFEAALERTPLHTGPRIVEVGSGYGSWPIPEGVVEPSWVCYCVGAGGDVSFDLDLIRRYGATVRAFDPVAAYIDSALAQAQGQARFSAHQAAIAKADGPLRMQLTHDRGSSSVSSAGLYDSDRFVELPGRTLPSLMKELGDERIELLKLDVEGAEYEILPQLDLRRLGVELFAVQLHHTGTVRQARALIGGLAREGYVAVARMPVVKLVFLAEERLAGRGSPAPARA